MASPAGTPPSCGTQRGASRRYWNGRDSGVFHPRCRSLPAIRTSFGSRSVSSGRSGSSGSAYDGRSAIEELKYTGHHEELARATSGCSRMRVGVRVRPPFLSEVENQKRSGGYRPAVKISRQGCVELISNGRQRSFLFDYAFDETCQQYELYQSLAAPVVDGCLTGLNGLIIAYGQTASGKSHSMGILQGVDLSAAGSAERGPGDTKDADEPPTLANGKMAGSQSSSHNQIDPGIIPRALSRVFTHVQGSSVPSYEGSPAGFSVNVKLSLLQVYNEAVQSAGLHIRENPSLGFFVEGLREYSVRSHQEAAALINLGLQQRTTARTAKNDISSRSHTVLTITIDRPCGDGLFPEDSVGDIVKMAGQRAGSRSKSKLVLVDLAGSERGRKSSFYAREESEPERLREAGYINQSLSALGNVIAALGQVELDRPHIPFRDSKLTRILADSMGGNANAAVVATVGPAPQNQAETLSTLVFASRCMRVQCKPVRHEERHEMVTIDRLQAQLSNMQREFCRREALQQSRYETVVTRLAQELEYARKSASSGRNLRRLHDQEAPATGAPVMTEPNPSGDEETSRGAGCCAPTPVSGLVESASWNRPKCTAAGTGSSTDGQTETESVEGVEGRAGALGGGGPNKANVISSAGEIPASVGDTAVETAETVETELAAWEILGVALRTLEVVGQKGAEIVEHARRGSHAVPKHYDLIGRQARTGNSVRTASGASKTAQNTQRNKVQILQRMAQLRKLCEEQWAEIGAQLSSALREKASVEQLLHKESLERRRKENKARRLVGALRHLLADSNSLDCAGTAPASTGALESERESSYGPSSLNNSGQKRHEGLFSVVPRARNSGSVVDHGPEVAGMAHSTLSCGEIGSYSSGTFACP